MMAKIAKRTEESDLYEEIARKHDHLSFGIVDAVSSAVVMTARSVGAKAIVVLSERGFTPRMISRYKPGQPIFVLTPHTETRNTSILSFGTVPEISPAFTHFTIATEYARNFLEKNNYAKKGDIFVLCAGMPFGQSGSTNLLSVHLV